MTPHTKRLARKQPNDTSPELVEFAVREHQVRIKYLLKLKFGQLLVPDLRGLEEIKLGDDMA